MSDPIRPSSGDLPVDVLSMKESTLPNDGSAPSEPPSLADRAHTHAEAGLTACARTEANFFGLVRSIQDAATILQGALEARGDVRVEIECLRSLLLGADEEQRLLKERVSMLERELDRAGRGSDQERSVLINEADAFIAELCDEHERVVLALEQRVALLEAREDAEIRNLLPGGRSDGDELELRLEQAEAELVRLGEDRESAQRSLLRLEAQRDEAQQQALRATRERDQLRSELSSTRASSSSVRTATLRDSLKVTRTPPGGIAVTLPELPMPSRDFGANSPSSQPPPRHTPDRAGPSLVRYSVASSESSPGDPTRSRGSGTDER